MFYYRDYTFDEAGWIFCLTATFSRKVCCIVTYLAEHTVIYSFTFFILYRIPFFVKKNFFKSHRNSFHVHFCHCFFILIVLMLCIIQLQELLHKFYVTQLQNIESEYYLQTIPRKNNLNYRELTFSHLQRYLLLGAILEVLPDMELHKHNRHYHLQNCDIYHHNMVLQVLL